MKIRLCVLAALVCCTAVTGQKQGQPLVDSLRHEALRLKDDTASVALLNALAYAALNTEPEEALTQATRAQRLARKIGWQKGLATAYRMCGNAHSALGAYDSAVACFNQALTLSEAINDLPGVASNVGNLGGIYHDQGNYPKAMEYLLRALADFEKLGDVFHQAVQLGNIGRVYEAQGNFDAALTKYRASMNLYRQIKNDRGVAEAMIGISNVYAAQKNYGNALQYGFEALSQNKALNNRYGMANADRTIGQIYYLQGDHPRAAVYWYSALNGYRAVDANREIAGTLANLAAAYLDMYRMPNDSLPDSLHNKPRLIDKALALLKTAAETNADVGDRYTDAIIYENLYLTYEASGNYAEALRYHERYVEVRDSIFSEENNQRIEALSRQREEDLKQNSIELLKVQVKSEKRENKFYLAGLVAFLIFSTLIVYQYRNVLRERMRSDKLLLNILPHHTANELKEHGHSEARHYENVSVLFTDFVEFSKMTKTLPAKELVALIDWYYKGFDKIMAAHGLEKIKTIGDSYMAACGVPVLHADHALRAVRTAIDVAAFVEREERWRKLEGMPFFHVRIGINSGAVVAGIVGDAKFAFDIWGDTVNLAARMEQNGVPGKINVSGSTYALVKDSFQCTHRGRIAVKHGAEADMYFVTALVQEPLATA